MDSLRLLDGKGWPNPNEGPVILDFGIKKDNDKFVIDFDVSNIIDKVEAVFSATDKEINEYQNNLKAIRKSAHITQEKLANAIGVGRQTILNWEKGYFPLQKTEYIALQFYFMIEEKYRLAGYNCRRTGKRE